MNAESKWTPEMEAEYQEVLKGMNSPDVLDPLVDHRALYLAARLRLEEEVKEERERILKLTQHGIPFYAYGDNQAACEMARDLEEIANIVSQEQPTHDPDSE